MRVSVEHRLSSLMAGCITTVITALLHSGRFDRALITLTWIVASGHTYGMAYPSKLQMADVKLPVQCPAQSVQSKAYV